MSEKYEEWRLFIEWSGGWTKALSMDCERDARQFADGMKIGYVTGINLVRVERRTVTPWEEA